MNPDIRWKQRFSNFDRGVNLLREALEHSYDSAVFEQAVRDIAMRYLPAMEALHKFLSEEGRR